MNHYSKKEIKDTLKDQKMTPFKGLGQNFLVNNEILQKIIKAANINPEDIILEIGPGTGILTKELAKKAKKVIAVEKDLKMCQVLEKTLKNFKNVEIVQGDALKILTINHKLPTTNYKVVANLPYYIASPVIRMFLEAGNQPSLMVLMVQKEVAQRICAKPPKMNLLAVSVQFYAKPEIISFVKKESFWPKPKVDGAILKLAPLGKCFASTETFFRVVKAGFLQPRKQIINNLASGLELEKGEVKLLLSKIGIQPNQRAETLEIKNWIDLLKTI
jgi:16S rRNA (adenine1518-N6/adenine1519-N6)-dimethyltransferase